MLELPIDRVIDLIEPDVHRIHGMTLEEARRRIASGDPASVRGIDGSFAIAAWDGDTVRLARSLDRPMRYFLAKRTEGPALVVADRIAPTGSRRFSPTCWTTRWTTARPPTQWRSASGRRTAPCGWM